MFVRLEKGSFVTFRIFVSALIIIKQSVSILVSLSLVRSLLQRYAAEENTRSASTEVGVTIYNIWYISSNKAPLFPVCSARVYSYFKEFDSEDLH